MDIFLSGDIRKDKTKDGYILNPNHYPNIFTYSASTLVLSSWPRNYNMVLDSFDYSGNFIERKNGYYDRGTTGLGFGIDFNFNNIGYRHNLYLSGSTNFTGFSGFTVNNNNFSYADFNKNTFTINGLPDYSGLTITSATTLYGNVFIKLDIGEGTFVQTTPYTSSTFNYNSINLDISNSFIDDTTIAGLNPGVYEIILNFSSSDAVNLQVFDGPDILSPKIYEYDSGGNYPYNQITAFTVNLLSNVVTLYNSSLSNSLTINDITFNEINYNTITTYMLTGKTKNLIQYNIDGDNFTCELYKNSKFVRVINESGSYSDVVDFSGDTANNTWVNFFMEGSNKTNVNNIKLFSLL
jgi:hypothetical protein